MARVATNAGYILTAKFNGSSARCDFGWTEKYVLPDNADLTADAAKARKVVMYRLNTLPEVCYCVGASMGLLNTPNKTRMVLTSPTDGAFGASTASGSPHNVTISGPSQTVQITAEEELKIGDPSTASNFLLQGDGFTKANRFLHGVPDLFVEDFALQGAASTPSWLDAEFAVSAGDPDVEGSYILNLIAFMSCLKELTRMISPNPAFTTDPDAPRFILSTIEDVAYRGMTTKKVGRPFKLLVGKASAGR